jgi:hypothetical protein
MPVRRRSGEILAIDLLTSGFTGTRPERIEIDPRDANAARIGHFGFIRPEHRATPWPDAAAWLLTSA